MQTYIASFTIPRSATEHRRGHQYPITATYYGEALTTELLKSIQADLHTRFDYTDATGKNAKIKILSIKQEGV